MMKLYLDACIVILASWIVHKNLHKTFQCKWYSQSSTWSSSSSSSSSLHSWCAGIPKAQIWRLVIVPLLFAQVVTSTCTPIAFCGLHWERNISLKIKVTDDCYKDMCPHVQSVLILPVHMWNSDRVNQIIYLHYKTTHINSTAN